MKGPSELLLVNRILPAPPERVFRSFVEPDRLARWFAPGDMRTVVHELDARPGGRYRVDMVAPDGTTHQLEGTYQEVDPPRLLVFTWRWLHEPDATLVRIELRAVRRGTEFLLTHERFAGAEQRQRHLDGWEGCLAKLPSALQ